MPASPESPALDQSVIDQLACPACFGALHMETDSLRCGACGRLFPVVDGIPVLIPDRAACRQP
jgi:uncharacterized protein YbaR (Trm112 family)